MDPDRNTVFSANSFLSSLNAVVQLVATFLIILSEQIYDFEIPSNIPIIQFLSESPNNAIILDSAFDAFLIFDQCTG